MIVMALQKISELLFSHSHMVMTIPSACPPGDFDELFAAGLFVFCPSGRRKGTTFAFFQRGFRPRTPARAHTMLEMRDIQKEILSTGRVDTAHLRALRERLYADGQIDRAEADFLAELHKRVQRPNPGFERLFYEAIRDHVLADGGIDGEKT